MLTIEQGHQDNVSANFPTTSAVNVNYGYNIQGGPLESIQMRSDILFGANPCAASASSLITTMRCTLNGEVQFSWSSAGGSMGAALDSVPDSFGYFINSLGGNFQEVTGGTTTREFYLTIPMAQNLTSAVNRMEIAIGYAATAASATPTSGQVSFWQRYNTAISERTLVGNQTSFAHSANAVETVVVKVPQNGMAVSGILVQSANSSTQYGSQGIRVSAMSGFGLEPSMWRELNGDLNNGIKFYDPAVTTSQSFATEVKAALYLPVFGLKGGDITLVVDSSAGVTRFYTPVMTSPIGGGKQQDVKQTQSVNAKPSGRALTRAQE